LTTIGGGLGGGRLDEPAPSDDGVPTLDAFGVLRHHGAWMSLSPTHEAIMRVLIARFGRPVARGEVATAVWPTNGRNLHAIDVHIHRLRPRLHELGLVLHTLRGRGFLLEKSEQTGGPDA
jgi:DNA-binding response OmpR family regulator